MRVTMLLADSAQAVNGKLYILGGGWDIIGSAPTPTAVALRIVVPWNESNMKHRWRLQLQDADGKGVKAGEKPIEFNGKFEVGRPPGHTPGTPIAFPLAINLAPSPFRRTTDMFGSFRSMMKKSRNGGKPSL